MFPAIRSFPVFVPATPDLCSRRHPTTRTRRSNLTRLVVHWFVHGSHG